MLNNSDTTKDSASSKIISICQIAGIFAVILASIINLSLGDDKAVLWSSLLSGSLGYLLPAPKVRNRNDAFLSNASLKRQHGDISEQYSDQVRDEVTESNFG